MNGDDSISELPDEDGLTREQRQAWKLNGFNELPPTSSIPAAAKFLGISRSSAYACVNDGTITAIKMRGRWVVTRTELFRILFTFGPV